MIKKSPEAYRTIGEASNEIGVPTYVLRFWETKFKQVKLIKRPGGRRFYKPEDIKLLLKIKNFLKNDGLSIKQVNEKLNSEIDNIKSNNSNNNEYINPVFEEKTTFKNKDEVLNRLNKILEILSK
jgi:DNA-binding transcriptional MerR regulator